MSDKAEIPPALIQHTLWENAANPIWLCSKYHLRRNLAKHLFPPKMTESEGSQVLGLLKETLLKTTQLDHPLFIGAETFQPLEKEFLLEHFLSGTSFQNTLAGQGFVVDQSGHFFALLNVEDHLQIELIDTQGEWLKSYNRLSDIETSMGSVLEYAFSSRFGYLTSDPTESGTALSVYVYLHVPALIHMDKVEEILLKQNEEEVLISSLEGHEEDFVGDLLVLRNTFTLGVSEENILQSLNTAAMKWMAAEKTARQNIQQTNNSQIKDQVSRSYGLLIHSYQLATKEALDALSLVKLGLDLGWIAGVTDQQLNIAYFTCRRAHLTHHLNAPAIDPQELNHKRAEFLHQQFQGMQLKI